MADEGPAPKPEKVMGMSLETLRNLLRSHRLSTAGRRDVLIRRVLALILQMSAADVDALCTAKPAEV